MRRGCAVTAERIHHQRTTPFPQTNRRNARRFTQPAWHSHKATLFIDMPLSEEPPDRLKRLPKAWYRGNAWVHWTMTIDNRQKSWLDQEMHHELRELMVHVSHRFHLICAAYCLMPDHGHFLWMGLSDSSDQLAAMDFFRRKWNLLLAKRNMTLQRQAYDHVLVESERNKHAFEDTVIYIFKNPERAKLVTEWIEWSYLGAITAGYPDFQPREWRGWWERFWTVFNKETSERKR